MQLDPLKSAMRLRPSTRNPVILLVSREAVDTCDVERVYKASIRFLMATPEDAATYRQQVSLAFEGFDEDPRELVDIKEVRLFIQQMTRRWPEWSYFLSQADESIPLVISVLAGSVFPGGGAVEISPYLLKTAMGQAFTGMNSMYARFQGMSVDEDALALQSMGFAEVVRQMG